MTTLSRREMFLAPVALAATSTVTTAASEKKMTLAMHQNTSNKCLSLAHNGNEQGPAFASLNPCQPCAYLPSAVAPMAQAASS
jgi:hypothetical protein